MSYQTAASYAEFVEDIRRTYSREYLPAQQALGVNVRSYREWDTTDLVNLHHSYFGQAIFNHFVYLAGEARREAEEVQKDPQRKTFAFAQHDLTALAPHHMGWQGFATMIETAMTEVQAYGFQVKQGLKTRFAEDSAAVASAVPPSVTRH